MRKVAQQLVPIGYSAAEFSDCLTYRYGLWRIWNEAKPICCFVGLNPSTADEKRNDPTITRCVGFASLWGFGGVVMANLFAFRATNPVDLLDQSDPVGPDNDRWLEEFSGTCAEMVVCWGVFGGHRDRANHVTSLLGLKRGLSCMGYSKIGFPRHPLYLPYTSQLEEYPPRGSQQNGHPDAKNSPSPC